MSTVSSTARQAGRRAAHGDGIEYAGRLGLVAKGVSYALIGVVALQVPLGNRDQAADRQGVLRQLATEPWGMAALIALAIGFAAYALWRFADALFDRGREGTGAKGLATRAVSFGIGVLYTASAALALLLVTSDSSSPSGRGTGDEQQETARVLDWPAGRWIVLAVAGGLLAHGVYDVYRGAMTKFRERLAEHEMRGAVHRWAIRSGVVGHIARGVVFAVVGVLLGKAALEYDPQQAVGIDGALQKLVDAPLGPVLLGTVAAGLVAYAVYGLVEARFREI
jgi:hypothetical protein